MSIKKTIDITLRTVINLKTSKGEEVKLYLTKFNGEFVFSDVELPKIEALVEDNFFAKLFGPCKSSLMSQEAAQLIADAITEMNKESAL